MLNIVEEATAADRELTVGGLADHLMVDSSVASRMVSDCITHGYLERAASQLDGRRTVLRMTQRGTELLALFRRQQRQAYEHITREWPPTERTEFARLLVKYATAAAQLPPPDDHSTAR